MVQGNSGHEGVPSTTRNGFGIGRRRFLQLAGVAGVGGALGVSTASPATAAVEGVPVEESDITAEEALESIEYDLEHPRVYHAPEDVAVARSNAENTAWGQRMKESVVETARRWPFVEMTAEDLYSLAPVSAPDGTTYFASADEGGVVMEGNASPVDGSDLHVEYDNPGHVVDENGNVFPGEVDGVTLDDDGDGVMIDPEEVPNDWRAAEVLDEPVRFWFVAKYNGLIADDFTRVCEPLAYSYLLAEDDAYATTTAMILDMLTQAFRTSFDYVVDQGPYPWFDDPPRRKAAKLHEPYYEVARFLARYINAMDLVWGSGALETEAATNPGTSIKEHVAENLVVAGADWCWRDMWGGLPEKDLPNANYAAIYHNGTTDFNKALLAASSLLSLDVGYAKWALDGQVSLRNFLANTIFRDGSYYETSSLYQVSFLEFADLAHFTSNDTYPEGVDVYDDSRFINLNVVGPRRQSVAGRIPVYGDVSRIDLGVDTEPLRGDFEKTLRFYARADDEQTRNGYAKRLAEIAGGDPNERLGGGVSAYDTWRNIWPLFNIDGEIEGFGSGDPDIANRDSELLEGKGMAMFRSGEGHDRGAMMRYGSTLSHGHYDELGLWIYGAGRDLSYDPGQKPKDDFRASFQKQTVAHNTTVVNETSSAPPADDGGSVELFADRDGYTVAEVSNPQAYAHEDAEEYRRTTAFVDVDDDRSYLFDVFRVAGAEQTDFSFHGKGTDFDTTLDLSAPAEGSVASSEYFWGDKIADNGNVEGYGDVSRANVKPGNGYGFLGQPRSASGAETWRATWSVDRDGPPAKLRLTMLPDEDREIVVANAPDPLVEHLGLDPEETQLPYTLSRDEGATSQFVSVIEPVGDSFPVESVSELDTEGGDARFDPVAAELSLADGRTDYFLSATGGERFTAKLDRGSHLKTDAAFAMVRTDENGEIVAARMEGGTDLRAKFGGGRPMMLEGERATQMGDVVAIDEEGSSVVVDADLPTGDALAGTYLLIDAPEYSHNSPYRIASVESADAGSRVVLEELTIDLSRGSVNAVSGDTVEGPVEFPFTHTEGSLGSDDVDANEYFDGKRLATGDGDATTVENTEPSYTDLTVANPTGIEAGDSFSVVDVKTGDRATVPASAEVRRVDGEYEVSATDDVEFKPPKGGSKG